jgi:hypothetical protein
MRTNNPTNPFPWLPFWPKTHTGDANDEMLKIGATILALTAIFEALWFCLPN